jgi:hypothetical protein
LRQTLEHQHGPGHRRNQRHCRGAFVLDQAADHRGVELAQHHLLQTHHRGCLRASPAIGVEKRNRVQFDAVIVMVEDACDRHGVHVDGSVRQHDTLRRAGAAAGVKQLRYGVFVVSQDVRPLRRPRFQEILVFGIEIYASHPWPRLLKSLHTGRKIMHMEQNSRFGVLQDRAQFSGRQAYVERHHDGVGLGDAEISLEQLVRVGAEKSDPVTRLDACTRESGRQPLAALAESGVSEALRTAHDTNLGTIQVDSTMQASHWCKGNLHRQ